MTSEVEKRFRYHQVQDLSAIKDMKDLRVMAHDLAAFVERAVPHGREASTAITKLEEAVMWANAGIARAKGEAT